MEELKLYAVYNGYIGFNVVFKLVIARNETNAIRLAKKEFKKDNDKVDYYTNLRTELIGNVDKEICFEFDTEG